MKSIFDKLFIIFIQGVLILSAGRIKMDNHLEEYNTFNVTHHDNIDDSSSTYQHTHKHSEDGPEHHHDHIKVTQFEVLKYYKCTSVDLSRRYSTESLPNFYDNDYFSNEHLPEIFRPPIS